jgi:hypothetical protein
MVEQFVAAQAPADQALPGVVSATGDPTLPPASVERTAPNPAQPRVVAETPAGSDPAPQRPSLPGPVRSPKLPPGAGPSEPGPSNPGPSNPGPSNPGPSNPGPSNPGPSNPGPSNPGPSAARPLGPEPDLLAAVAALQGELAALRLPLAAPGVDAARSTQANLLAHLDDYLLPRLRRMDAPVLAVIGGSTGAGKSTLVNALVRREVTPSGVLRPTTRSPVMVHHPWDSGAFLSQRVLPSLPRYTVDGTEHVVANDPDPTLGPALRLVPHDGMPSGIAIIDAPDIDSLVESNRLLATQLLAAADLWIFVTTAARYADAVPWAMLREAVERGVAVAVVLDRVPPEAMLEVRTHLATMLRDRGLATSPMFTIPETPRAQDGFLPQETVAPLLGWLTRLARDARSRDIVIRRTLVGSLDSLRDRVPTIAAAADAQVSADERLRDDLDDVYAQAVDQLEQTLSDGTILRGEVLARWLEFVGTGDVFRSLDAAGGLAERLGVRADVAPLKRLDDAVLAGVQVLSRAAAQAASDEAVRRWRARPEGAELLDSSGPVVSARQEWLAPDFDERLVATVQEWRALVGHQIQTANVERRSGGPAISPDGVAVVLLLAVACHGATKGSARPAGGSEVVTGTAEVTTRVLGALLGERAAPAVINGARADLTARMASTLDAERTRIESLLDAAGVRDGRGETLRAITAAIEGAR